MKINNTSYQVSAKTETKKQQEIKESLIINKGPDGIFYEHELMKDITHHCGRKKKKSQISAQSDECSKRMFEPVALVAEAPFEEVDLGPAAKERTRVVEFTYTSL